MTWASSDPTVATIDGSGLATAVVVGTAAITAAQGDVTSAPAMLDVTAPPPVPSLVVRIEIRRSPKPGDRARFYVWVEDGSGSPVAGASVALTLDTGGQDYGDTRTTNDSGRASFRIRTGRGDSLPWTIAATATKGDAGGTGTITYAGASGGRVRA